MKNLQEIKEDYALEQGYEEWEHLINDMQPHSNMYLEQAMDEICIRAQKEALEKAAENGKIEILVPSSSVPKSVKQYKNSDGVVRVNMSSITNPENLIR